MTFLPIVDRELRVAARLKRTYWNRALAAGLVAAVAMAMLFFGELAPFPSQVGKAMFATLSHLTLALCLLEGVRKTADCISEERREGTLGLLFLTDLRGYDVVLGKMAGASLNSIYGLLAMLPVLALSLLLGGVTEGEFWRMALALLNALFFALAAGMLASAYSQNERGAMSGAFLLVLAWMLIPPFIPVHAVALLGPGHTFRAAFEAAYLGPAADFWPSLLATHLVAWGFLGWSSLAVSRFRAESRSVAPSPGGRQPWDRRQFNDAARRGGLRRELLEINPILWLAGRDQGQRLFLWSLIAIVAATTGLVWLAGSTAVFFVPLYFAMIIIVNFILKVRVAAQACHFFAEARASNALEMLLATPLTVNEILDGQIAALRRAFLGPVAALFIVEAAGGVGMIVRGSASTIPALGGVVVFLLGAALYLVMAVLDVMAVVWAGMWFGLSSKRESQAAFKTIGYVLLLPLSASILCYLSYPLFLAWPIICRSWAANKLRYEFRRIAGQRFDGGAAGLPGWTFKKTSQAWLPPVRSANF